MTKNNNVETKTNGNNNVETKTNGNNNIETKKAVTNEAAANSKVAEMTPEAKPETKPTVKTIDAAEKNRMIEMILKEGEEKQEAARKRQQFINARNIIKDLQDKLSKSKDFEVDFCKLTIKKLEKIGYNPEFKDIFSISNREILMEFCEWLDVRIEAKLESLEEELLK